MLYLQGIHNTCSKHKIIHYLRNHIWHSWYLRLPKIQNKFILILIWSGDNKTQRNATQRASAFTHTDTHIERRGKMYYNVAGKKWQTVHRMNFSLRFFHAATKHAGETKRAGRTSQYDTGWHKTVKRPVRLSGVREVYRKCSRIAVTSHTLARRDRSNR